MRGASFFSSGSCHSMGSDLAAGKRCCTTQTMKKVESQSIEFEKIKASTWPDRARFSKDLLLVEALVPSEIIFLFFHPTWCGIF